MNEPSNRPNIVFITIDSLRADHCGFLGYSDDITPTLDNLAANGTIFTNAIAPGPSTAESVPAIVTGSYPFERSEANSEIDRRIAQIKPHLHARRTIAERLSKLGYSTAAFTPSVFTSRYFGYDEGFDYFQDFLDGHRNKIYQSLLKGFKESRFYLPARLVSNLRYREEAFKPWEDFYDEIIEWIVTQDRPYFIWIFLMDVHHPYLADKSCRSQSILKTYLSNLELRRQEYDLNPNSSVHDWLVQSYDDSINYIDSCIEQLKSDLCDENTVFVVTSDHGEAFGEHDSYEHHGGSFGQEGKQEYHSYLYEENIHVPLVIGNYGDSDVFEEPMSLKSTPELLQRIATGSELTGITNRFVVSKTLDNNKIAVRGLRYKAIATSDGIEVYDLKCGEVTPVTEAKELYSAFESFVRSVQQKTIEREKISKHVRTSITEHNLSDND